LSVTGGTTLITRSDRYRAKAAECEAAARKVADQRAREAYLDIARQWRELAAQVELVDREKST
jgi:hypothetical protein